MFKMTLQIHLEKSGSGMSSMTACGRNTLRTPMSCKFEEFKTEKHQCTKCLQSKLFAFLTKQDAKKETLVTDDWVAADDPDAWKTEDDKIMAAHKQKKK